MVAFEKVQRYYSENYLAEDGMKMEASLCKSLWTLAQQTGMC
jgi:hypothetical protein